MYLLYRIMLGFKAYQLKDIIRQYVEKTEKKITKSE